MERDERQRDEQPPERGRFAEVNTQIESLFDGIPADERLAAGKTFYFDADGTPQLRRNKLRAVDND